MEEQNRQVLAASLAQDDAAPQKPKRAFFLLRAVGAFALLLGLLALLYLWGYHSYPTVAEWEAESNHEALIYEDETYVLVGVIGKKGLNLKKYPIDKVLGKIKDDGSIMMPETVTLPPDTEEGETLKITPPDGDPTLPHEHTYILYSVEDQEDYLLVLEKDGEYYLYQKVSETETVEAEAND